MKRSGSALSSVMMRFSKKRTFWINGILKFIPGSVITCLTSPSWKTTAN